MNGILASQKKKKNPFNNSPHLCNNESYHIAKDCLKASLPVVLKLNYSSQPTRKVTERKSSVSIMTNWTYKVKEDTGRAFVETES